MLRGTAGDRGLRSGLAGDGNHGDDGGAGRRVGVGRESGGQDLGLRGSGRLGGRRGGGSRNSDEADASGSDGGAGVRGQSGGGNDGAAILERGRGQAASSRDGTAGEDDGLGDGHGHGDGDSGGLCCVLAVDELSLALGDGKVLSGDALALGELHTTGGVAGRLELAKLLAANDEAALLALLNGGRGAPESGDELEEGDLGDDDDLGLLDDGGGGGGDGALGGDDLGDGGVVLEGGGDGCYLGEGRNLRGGDGDRSVEEDARRTARAGGGAGSASSRRGRWRDADARQDRGGFDLALGVLVVARETELGEEADEDG